MYKPIDPEELKELISDKLDERYRWDSKLTICEFKTIVGDIIDNAPTVGEKQGEWIERTDYNLDTYYDCSVCGNSWTTIEGTPWNNGMNFCPNCGAEMRSKP